MKRNLGDIYGVEETLPLFNSNLTKAEIEKLQKALPNCKIIWVP